MPPKGATVVPRRAQARRRAGTARIPVLLAEEHRVLRDALQSLLRARRDMVVVGTVADGAAAVKEAERLSPRAILMGILLPGLDGIEATRLIVQRASNAGVVILSPHHSPVVVRRALEAGALGYVTTDCPVREVLRALRAVAAGRRYLGQGVAEGFYDDYRGAARTERAERTVEHLTSMERNILKLVVDGKTNPEVAGVLGLSPRTVETYRIRLMRKLGIESLAGLVKYAIRHGISKLD